MGLLELLVGLGDCGQQFQLLDFYSSILLYDLVFGSVWCHFPKIVGFVCIGWAKVRFFAPRLILRPIIQLTIGFRGEEILF